VCRSTGRTKPFKNFRMNFDSRCQQYDDRSGWPAVEIPSLSIGLLASPTD